MTLEEAKKVLGLAPNDDPADRLEQFDEARERIAGLVNNAPNETIALRYQDGLLEFDKAMAAIREEIERRRTEKVADLVALVPSSVSGLHVVNKKPNFIKPVVEVTEPAAETLPPIEEPEKQEQEPVLDRAKTFEKVPPAKQLEKPEPSTSVPSEGADDDEEFEESAPSSKARFFVYALVFLLIGGIGGGWIYTSNEADKKRLNQQQIIYLEKMGATLIESRLWDLAREAYQEIEQRDPGSELAEMGMRSIEVGMTEEQTQFVGYWSGEALAAYEGGRIDDAAVAARKVLAKYPDEAETEVLLEQIEAARIVKLREGWQEKIRAGIRERDWETADGALAGLTTALPGDSLIQKLASEITEEKEQEQADLAKAGQLAESARLRDKGEFDRQALEWAREAVALVPDDPELKALYEKLASYSRTLRVPQDVKTLAEAISQARDRDRIVLGEGEFAGGVVINSSLQLEGAGDGKTVISVKASQAPVLTIGPGAKGATVSGLTLRHLGFDAGTSRFPVALVRGAEMEFSDCIFLEGSGHGLASVDGGNPLALRCIFKTNGWDGAAASGAESRLTIRNCESVGNFGHGYEVWDGAAAIITGSKASKNCRNGVLVDSAGEGIEISGGSFDGNREYGIVLGAGASGTVKGNGCSNNLLGGLLVRFAAISVVVEGNKLEKNSGPGLLLERGLRPGIYEGNRSRSNRGRDVMSQVRFQDGE